MSGDLAAMAEKALREWETPTVRISKSGASPNELAMRAALEAAGVPALLAEVRWRDAPEDDWLEAQAGHDREVGETAHPADTAEEWCASCSTPDEDCPDWPCPGVLADLGLADADAYRRVEAVQADRHLVRQYAELADIREAQIGRVRAGRDRLRAALERIADGGWSEHGVVSIARGALEATDGRL